MGLSNSSRENNLKISNASAANYGSVLKIFDGRTAKQLPNEKIDKKKQNNPENRRPRPDANSHVLELRLLLQDPPDKLSKIARELNIEYQTLNSHWKRTGLALVKEIALKFEYINPRNNGE